MARLNTSRETPPPPTSAAGPMSTRRSRRIAVTALYDETQDTPSITRARKSRRTKPADSDQLQDAKETIATPTPDHGSDSGSDSDEPLINMEGLDDISEYASQPNRGAASAVDSRKHAADSDVAMHGEQLHTVGSARPRKKQRINGHEAQEEEQQQPGIAPSSPTESERSDGESSDNEPDAGRKGRDALTEKGTPHHTDSRSLTNKKTTTKRAATGKWKPGGPGRPPAGVNYQPTKVTVKWEDKGVLPESEEEYSDGHDEEGEKKIDANGELQGGREYIFRTFTSPYRLNPKKLYVLSMDCCKYLGYRDSYVLFKNNPGLIRLSATEEEREMFIKQGVMSGSMRKRDVAMVTARSLFRVFGALTIKDGRYVNDDYFEARSREEAAYPPGTVIAKMTLYRTLNNIRSTPALSANAASATPGGLKQRRGPKKSRSTVQRLLDDLNGFGTDWSAPPTPGLTPMRAGTPKSRSRSHTPYPEGPDGPEVAASPREPFYAAVRRRSYASLQSSLASNYTPRPGELCEDVFGYTISVYRQIFDESIGGSLPLKYSLANSPAKDTPPVVDPSNDIRIRAAIDFNRKLRAWRQWDDSIWYDPHTGVYQVPKATQPTRVWVGQAPPSSVDGIQHPSTFTSIDEILHFRGLSISSPPPSQATLEQPLTTDTGTRTEGTEGEYPLALMEGQYQQDFSIFTTRFGQSVEETEQQYRTFWSARRHQMLGRAQDATAASSSLASSQRNAQTTPQARRGMPLGAQIPQQFAGPVPGRNIAPTPHRIYNQNDAGYRCGFYAKSSGRPCKRLVSNPGERCLYHQNEEEAESVPSTPFSPQSLPSPQRPHPNYQQLQQSQPFGAYQQQQQPGMASYQPTPFRLPLVNTSSHIQSAMYRPAVTQTPTRSIGGSSVLNQAMATPTPTRTSKRTSALIARKAMKESLDSDTDNDDDHSQKSLPTSVLVQRPVANGATPSAPLQQSLASTGSFSPANGQLNQHQLASLRQQAIMFMSRFRPGMPIPPQVAINPFVTQMLRQQSMVAAPAISGAFSHTVRPGLLMSTMSQQQQQQQQPLAPMPNSDATSMSGQWTNNAMTELGQLAQPPNSYAACTECGRPAILSEQSKVPPPLDPLNVAVACSGCKDRTHIHCLLPDPPPRPTIYSSDQQFSTVQAELPHSLAVLSYPWQCEACKKCCVCGEIGDEAQMVICDTCERGWHIGCCDPRLSEVPQGDWRCYNCAKCQGCGNPQADDLKDWLVKGIVAESAPDAEVAPFVKGAGQAILGPYCGECRERARQGYICGVCCQTWGHNSEVTNSARQCSACHARVHAHCDPAPPAGLAYICPPCSGRLHANVDCRGMSIASASDPQLQHVKARAILRTMDPGLPAGMMLVVPPVAGTGATWFKSTGSSLK